MPRHWRSIDLFGGYSGLPFQALASALILFKTISGRRSCTEVLRDAQRKYWAKSEAGLADAGDLALVSQLTEADTADAVVAQISVGAAADLAAVVLAGGELSRSLLFQNHRFLSHISSPP